MNRSLTPLAGLFVCAAASYGALAQTPGDYPTKPIRFVVPFPPGGTTEIQARRLADMLRQKVGQPVVIDNRPGANGSIGMGIVAKAAADGYTIILANVGNWAVHPHLYKLDYDVLRDFAPIIQVATSPGLVIVNPSVPVKTVHDLVALAKQKPGQLNYGSNGAGGFSHLAGELFCSMTGTRMTHIPYKGAAPVLTDLVGGHIELSFNSVVPSLPHVKSGRVRAIAATGAARIALLPELPTVAESGLPGYEAATWSGIAAPAGTPQPIVQRLNRELAALLASPQMQETARAEGSTINGGSPAQFRTVLKEEHTKYGKLVRQAGIRAAP
jgi:tripartite-type tricarboxylate transporter receptor subunit TctC